MFRFVRRLSVACVALLMLSLSFVSPAFAADEVDGTVTWMVRPSDGVGEDGRSWIEQELDPGETVEEHLVIRNLSQTPVVFRLTAADGYFTETGRFNMLTSDKTSVDAGTWIQIADTVEVPSDGDVVVPFTVTVPENATPGDHPAGVAASIRSGEDEQIGVESRVGFRVMTRVTGELAPEGAAEISGAYGGTWNPFEAGRVDTTYSITNTGNTRLSLTPEVTVSAFFGLVTTTIAGEEIAEIAPGETRTAEIRFPNMWPLFAYSAQVTASAEVITTGDEAPPQVADVTASTTVIAIPWPQLITLLIAALLIWWLWSDRRRRDRKLATMLEQARTEGRKEPTMNTDTRTQTTIDASLRRDRSNCARTAITGTLLTVGIIWGATPAFADVPAPERDRGSVTLRVDVTPSVAPDPTASPSPAATGGATTLPATGAPDLAPLAVAAGVLLSLGAGAWFARGPLSQRRSNHTQQL